MHQHEVRGVVEEGLRDCPRWALFDPQDSWRHRGSRPLGDLLYVHGLKNIEQGVQPIKRWFQPLQGLDRGFQGRKAMVLRLFSDEVSTLALRRDGVVRERLDV